MLYLQKRSFTTNRVMKHILALFVSVALILFAGVNLASAATLQLSTEKDAFAIGDQFTVDVKVDSEGSGINAVQGVVQISKDVLEIVGVDKSGSVFNFWLTEPTFSNDSGQVNFIGGSTSGFSGRSLQVVKVTFRLQVLQNQNLRRSHRSRHRSHVPPNGRNASRQSRKSR